MVPHSDNALRAIEDLQRVVVDEASSQWLGSAAVHLLPPPAAAAGEPRGPRLAVEWRQPWACPPPLQPRGRDGEALEPGGPASCAAPGFSGEELWWIVHDTTRAIVTVTQTAPGDEGLVPLLAAALRCASAAEELWCTLRWMRCFAFGAEERLAKVCSVMDLALLQLASDLGLEASALSPLPGGFCGAAAGSFAESLSQALTVLLERLEGVLQRRWSVERWPLLLVPVGRGLKAVFGNTLLGEPLVSYQGGPGGSMIHYAAAAEFSPLCDSLARRSEDAPHYSGEGHSMWIDSTGTLTWHLSVADLGEALLGLGRTSWTIVNFGAEDGACNCAGDKFWMYDPANCLLEAFPGPARGVLLEGNPESLQSLRTRYAGRGDVLCVADYVAPATATDAMLAAAPCDASLAAGGAEAEAVRRDLAAGEVDLFKIDVDFGDCDFLEAIVPRLRPKFVHAEMNPHYPPPFAQRQHFDGGVVELGAVHPSDAPGAGGPAHWLRGCSLSGIAQALGGRSQYVPVQVEFDHALFVRADLAERLVPRWPRMAPLRLFDHWLSGYYCHPLRRVAREDERSAGFDFRRLAPAGLADLGRGGAEGAAAEAAAAQAETEMRALLLASGGVEVPRQGPRARAPGAAGRFPFSLQRCDACG